MLNKEKPEEIELGTEKTQIPQILQINQKEQNSEGGTDRQTLQLSKEKENLASNSEVPKLAKLLSLTSVLLSIVSLCLFGVGLWMFSFSSRAPLMVTSDSGTIGTKIAELETEDPVEKNVHYLGILPLMSPAKMAERFSGVEKYLRKETGLNIKLKLYPTTETTDGYTKIVRDIVDGKITFAYLASVTTVQAQRNNPAVMPFVCAQKNGSPTYRGDLAVQVNSNFHSLEDLEGRKVSGASRSSTSGGLMPAAMLKNSSVRFDGGMIFLGSHDKVAEAVIAGTMDACFINETTFNKYNKEAPKLKSIWRHDSVPEFPFNVNRDKITTEDLDKVKEALLMMHRTDLRGIQIVDENYEKWVEIEWEDYLGVKKAIDDVYGPIFYDLDKWEQKAN